MSDGETKKVEQRGYARGYVAGRKRLRVDREAERITKERQAFMDKAFLAALPFAMQQATWKHGDKPINSIKERVDLAWDVAASALKTRRSA